jgi:hypothetical protein
MSAMPVDVQFLGQVLFLLLFALNCVTVVVPIRVLLKNRSALEPEYEAYEAWGLNGAVKKLVADIRELDFAVRGYWCHKSHTIASSIVILLEQPHTLDRAKVLFTVAGSRSQLTFLFQVKYEDDTEIITANNRLTVGLPKLPETTSVWLPEIHDAHPLYRVHRQISDSLGAGKKPMPIGPDPVVDLIAEQKLRLGRYVETGY